MAVDAVMSGGGFGFLLPATAYEPEDVAFSLASPAIRNRLHAEAGRVAARVWDASRAAGLDRLGKPLAPIAPATVEARRKNRNPFTGKKPYSPMGRAKPFAPPLTPVNGASRTRAYLRHRTAPGRGVWFYHRFDNHTRHYWGEILARHGRGFVQRFRSGFRFVPPRDVLGFSDAELAAVREAVGAWWRARRPKGLPGEPLVRREPLPIPIDPTQPRRRPGPREVIVPEVISGRYGIGTGDDEGFTESSGWFRRTTGWTPPPSWTKPTPPRRPPPATPAAMPIPMPILPPRRATGPIVPSVPVGNVARRVARLVGRRLDREMMGQFAAMATLAPTAGDAEQRARQEATSEAKALWRALAILLRAGVSFVADRRAG